MIPILSQENTSGSYSVSGKHVPLSKFTNRRYLLIHSEWGENSPNMNTHKLCSLSTDRHVVLFKFKVLEINLTVSFEMDIKINTLLN